MTHLRDVFVEQIIPLLREYFYEDWRKVCQVLGKPSESSLIQSRRLKLMGFAGEDDAEDRPTYDSNPSFLSAAEVGLGRFFATLTQG